MSDEMKPEAPEMTPYRIVMQKIAAGILVVGLSASVVAFALAPPEVDDDYMGVYVTSIYNSKKHLLELERIGGKAAVVAAEITDWFNSLWHGRRLAGTLVVLSIGASLLCFLAGKIPPLSIEVDFRPHARDDPEQTPNKLTSEHESHKREGCAINEIPERRPR